MTGWAIVNGGTTVNLTPYPNSYRLTGSAVIDGLGIDGGGTIGISRYTDPEGFILKGCFAGTSETTIFSSYVTNLRAMKGKQVTITSPSSLFAGNWLLKNYEFNRIEGKDGTFLKIDYTLTFELYTANVNLF